MSICFIAAMARSDAGDVIFLQYGAVLGADQLGVAPGGDPQTLTGCARCGDARRLDDRGFGLGVGDWIGLCLALVAGFGYGGVIVSLRLLRGQDSVSVMALTQLVCVVLLVPFLQGHDPWLSGGQWAWVGGLAVVQYAVPYVLFAWGLKQVGAQEASILTLLDCREPDMVLLIWGQAIAPHTLIGAHPHGALDPLHGGRRLRRRVHSAVLAPGQR